MSGRILVVEDEKAAADYVAGGLREHGYVVETVDDGRDGLYLATSAAFDAVVLDRNLPGMDGLSMLKAMRAGGVETPVLI
ncbi:MAG: response regulator, partial [Pseudomonadota bacterium]